MFYFKVYFEYTLFFLYLNINFFSMLSTFPLYIFLFIFDISFFLRDDKGNKAVQLFCAISFAIDFFSGFCNSTIVL